MDPRTLAFLVMLEERRSFADRAAAGIQTAVESDLNRLVRRTAREGMRLEAAYGAGSLAALRAVGAITEAEEMSWRIRLHIDELPSPGALAEDIEGLELMTDVTASRSFDLIGSTTCEHGLISLEGLEISEAGLRIGWSLELSTEGHAELLRSRSRVLAILTSAHPQSVDKVKADLFDDLQRRFTPQIADWRVTDDRGVQFTCRRQWLVTAEQSLWEGMSEFVPCVEAEAREIRIQWREIELSLPL